MSDDNLIVFAKNRTEMAEAQQAGVSWVSNKLAEHQAILLEAQTNLDIAKKNKWQTQGWARCVTRAKKKVEYYEKLLAGVSAGYTIIPAFPIDVFAIRTKRAYPTPMYSTSRSEWSGTDKTQRGSGLALGEGEHFDSQPLVSRAVDTRTAEGKPDWYKFWADEYQDVDFPIKMVKPAIIEEVSRAMALKIFDEIGMLPGRPAFNSRNRMTLGADPIVVGRILFPRGGWSGPKVVSFLITWWLDFKDITV
jgi:hypothetical protein